ncbi:MAG: N-acetylglucosamine-6-phosphate deacetylase [Lentisphaeria bacterium]|nr:MAG: N-acetylglucosamine-6-phosphate deacetylase [Lentisphaeria bacterium]
MRNPGWVDLQVNGCGGVDFSDPCLTQSAFLRAAEQVLKSGTELFLPTLITSKLAVYRRNLVLIQAAVERFGLGKNIPGVHLEGPFISPVPGAAGAHNPEWIIPPKPETVEQLLNCAPGFIKLVTLGADTDGAQEAIRLLRRHDVAVSIGHHMANAAQIASAADAGAQALTHLGNGVPGMLPRHANPIWAGLAEDRLIAMIITDGHHLPAEVIRVICRTRSVEKIIVTSDASPAAGFSPGPCHVLGNDAVLDPSGRLYNPKTGFLVGSAAMLADCMNVLESLELFSEKELLRVGRENALALLRAWKEQPEKA